MNFDGSLDGTEHCDDDDAYINFYIWDNDYDLKDKLAVEGDLRWTGAKVGDTVRGVIIVKNIGQPYSLLHWHTMICCEEEEWGEWTFEPESGDFHGNYQSQAVVVTLTILKKIDKNGFKGSFRICGDSNSVDVPIFLNYKSRSRSSSFLLQFIESFPLFEQLFSRFLEGVW